MLAVLLFCFFSSGWILPVSGQSPNNEGDGTEENTFNPKEVVDALSAAGDIASDENLIDEEVEEVSEDKAWYNEITVVNVGLLLALIVTSVLWIVMLIDSLKRPLKQFPGVEGSRKILWVIGILVTHTIGSILYYFLIYRNKKKNRNKQE